MSFPGSPAYRQQLVGLSSLHNHMCQSFIMYVRGHTKNEVLGRRQQENERHAERLWGQRRGSDQVCRREVVKIAAQSAVLATVKISAPVMYFFPRTQPIAPKDFWEILSPCKRLICMDMNGVHWPPFPKPLRVTYFFQNGCQGQTPTILLFSLMFSLKWLTFSLIFCTYILNYIGQSVGLI